MSAFTAQDGLHALAETLHRYVGERVTCARCRHVEPGHAAFNKDEAGKGAKDGAKRRYWRCRRAKTATAAQRARGDYCKALSCHAYVLRAVATVGEAEVERYRGAVAAKLEEGKASVRNIARRFAADAGDGATERGRASTPNPPKRKAGPVDGAPSPKRPTSYDPGAGALAGVRTREYVAVDRLGEQLRLAIDRLASVSDRLCRLQCPASPRRDPPPFPWPATSPTPSNDWGDSSGADPALSPDAWFAVLEDRPSPHPSPPASPFPDPTPSAVVDLVTPPPPRRVTPYPGRAAVPKVAAPSLRS